LEAVYVRQHQVQDHEIGGAFLRLLDGVVSVVRDRDVEAFLGEVVPHELDDVWFVVDHENAAARMVCRLQRHREGPRSSELIITFSRRSVRSPSQPDVEMVTEASGGWFRGSLRYLQSEERREGTDPHPSKTIERMSVDSASLRLGLSLGAGSVFPS